MADEITIGGRILVFAKTFLLADNQVARITVDMGGGNAVTFELTMRPGEGDEPQTIRWGTENGVITLRAVGWRSPLGLMMGEPVALGDVAGRTFYFQLAHHFLAASNLVHFSVLLDGDRSK